MESAAAIAWRGLAQERERLDTFDMREAVLSDPARVERYRLQAAGLGLDYSRNRIDDVALAALLALARACNVQAGLRQQFGGAPVNLTEDRAALHTLLRGSDAGAALPQREEVRAMRERMAGLAGRIRNGDWTGWSGKRITAIVNIGIGGSHLGPCFVADALAHLLPPGLSLHFVSNVDPRDIEDTLRGLDPETTFFIVASKTFGTLETLQNASAARAWLFAGGCPQQAVSRHLAGVSANVARAVAFGIDEANVLPMWDWVGGRFSLWSSIGLPLAIGLGMDAFESLLLGAHRMDMHALAAAPEANMPVLLALLSVWYRNFWDAGTQAVLPYDQRLARLPEFLQQLVMESNGKSVDREGAPLPRHSCGVLWGTAGTNGQHSFHQMLHQGSSIVPVDFVLPLQTHAEGHAQHGWLVANGIAQAQALMQGRTLDEARAELASRGTSDADIDRLAPHLVMPGNRPSNTITMRRVDPETLGALISLYEHRTAVEGILWNLNSFDQFGVELGKQIGEIVHRAMDGDAAALARLDAPAAALIGEWTALNQR
jgi:glucose-6-phosphate isomerase